MIFRETGLSGAYLVAPERIRDERGSFARTWCAEEFALHGLSPRLAQCSVSWNRYVGTLRGLHYQRAPHAESKLVRVTRGSIFDVIVDLRPASPTRYRWFAAELDAESGLMMYVPEGFAHGFQTLEDDTEVLYQISVPYHAPSAAGLRWDDPALAIAWPRAGIRIISERDCAYPLLETVSASC
jgi:dTDP-4-dehydrorhamnose 3,5-epimerase